MFGIEDRPPPLRGGVSPPGGPLRYLNQQPPVNYYLTLHKMSTQTLRIAQVLLAKVSKLAFNTLSEEPGATTERRHEVYDECKRFCKLELQRELEMAQEIEKMMASMKVKAYFVTFRPLQGIDTVIKAVINFLETQSDHYELCFEQKGETLETMGEGAHAHMIVWSDAYSHAFTSKTINCFKKFMGTEWHPTSLKIGNNFSKVLKTQKDIDFTRNYMAGQKENATKDAAVKIDKLWREQLGLKNLFQPSTDGRDYPQVMGQSKAVNIEKNIWSRKFD